jgi:hypothetical protein
MRSIVMSRIFRTFVASGVMGAAMLGGCSDDRDGFVDTGPGPIVGADAGDVQAPQCGTRCSRDLKKVLNGCSGDEGEVIATCEQGQGCAGDKCVDACASAAASKGSIGCSFWTLPADDASYGAGACFAAMVANTWDIPVNLSADYGSHPLDISKSVYTATRPDPNAAPVYTPVTGALAPGQVAIVFLSQAEQPLDPQASLCPPGTTPAVMLDPIRHGTAKTNAFHLKSDVPISAYSIFPYGGAASEYPTATLLLPQSSWDTSYIAVSTAKFGKIENSSLDRRTLQIVAAEDDTKIAMRPTTDIAQGENVAPGVTGEVVEWTLAKGQVLQITQQNSASGSPFTASKPVGLFGGSPCTFLPIDKPFCDLTQQQIAPFAQWGNAYALVPYRPRIEAVTGTARESVLWSFVGAVDGTVLAYSPTKPPGAPERLDAGQVVAFQTDTVATVTSQDSKHPFHAAVYMSGSTNGGGSPNGGKTIGDPDFVNLVPSEQFLDRYVFFTDYTFPETSLTVVRRKTGGNFKPVRLECAGELGDWQTINDEFEFTWVRLTSGAIPQKVGSGVCGYGRQEAVSDGPFSVHVWGMGKDTSYGYAGGMGARPINDAPPPVVQ